MISLAGMQADLRAGVTKDAPRSRRETREKELVTHDPQAWLCISHRVQQGQAERALVGSGFKRQAVINYPGMPVSKERADRVLHDLEGLANLLLLAYRWDLNLPLPPEFPELVIQVLRDPDCPRASPSKDALPRQAEQQSASESRASPRRTPCLLDSAGVGRGRRIRELQKFTPRSPGVNLRVDPAEEEEFLQSHGV